MKDFTPTAAQISLHGLGFVQVKLPAKMRLHVWHPDLPRRSCFEHSAIHNHRFSFVCKVLVGTQVNQLHLVEPDENGDHDLISHDGPRSEFGGRQSYVAGRVKVKALREEYYHAGQSYSVRMLDYRTTPNSGVVVTLMTKLFEGEVHASSLIAHGHEFDQSFDRYQLSDDDLWAIVKDAFQRGGS